MRRLDGLSAFMVYSERPKWYQHTLKIAVLDYGGRPMPGYEALIADFSEGIAGVPMLQWRLARVPAGLNHPVWIQADDFDIRYHLRRVTCPAPGDERAFSSLVSELYAYPMDQSAPLWLCWIVDGLEQGRAAIVCLFHHAYTDGTGAARMLGRLLQPELHRDCPVARLRSSATPGSLHLLVSGLLDLPLLFMRELPGIVRGFRTLSRYRQQCEQEGVEMPPGPTDAPYSPFNTALSHRRTFVYKSFQLQDVKSISKTLGVTINDLYVAMCAGACRRFLQEKDYDCDAGPLVCSLPVNMRPPPEEDDLVGNLVGNGYMQVPVHIGDAAGRLRASHEAAQIMKRYLAATRDVNITRVMQLMPSLYARVSGWILERTRGRINQAGNMVLSNVPGPREALMIGDATVANWLSIGHVTGGVGLNLTAWSYCDKFSICLMADATVVPDGWVFMRYLEDALDEYRALSATAK